MTDEGWIGGGAYAYVIRIGNNPPYLAAKYIRIDPRRHVNFYEREINALQKLRHQNIVNFYGMCRTTKDRQDYYVIHMEYCERNSLRHIMNEPTIIYTMKTVFGWTEHLVEALFYLKKNNILHRDIKPENVLVTIDFVLKLGDFGFVKELNDAVHSMSMVGTDRYISPETSGFLREVMTNFKSDLYSVGLVMWEIVERRKVFTEPDYTTDRFNHYALFEDLRSGKYVLPFSFGRTEFSDIILRCTSFHPESRPDIEELYSQIKTMNESCTTANFEPTIDPNQRKTLKPVWLEMKSSDTSIETDSSFEMDFSLGSINAYIEETKSIVHKNQGELNIEIDLGDYPNLPMLISLKEAISNVKMLAIQGDKELLWAIEKQIKKSTRIPVEYYFSIDELPVFPSMIDKKLQAFFLERQYSKALVEKVEEALKICEDCFIEEFKTFLDGFVKAVHWGYRAMRNWEVSEMTRSLAEIYKLVISLSENFFYKQWFNRIFYESVDERWLLLSRKQCFFITGIHSKATFIPGEFVNIGSLEYFRESATQELYKPFINRGYHIEELLVELKYKLKNKRAEFNDENELDCLLKTFHLPCRSFPYTSYIFELGKYVSDCEEIKNSDIDYESLSDYETLRRTYEKTLKLLEIESTMTAESIQRLNILNEIRECKNDLQKPRECPNYLLFYLRKLADGEIIRSKTLLKLPRKGDQSVPQFSRGFIKFETVFCDLEDVETQGYNCIDVLLLQRRLDEMTERAQDVLRKRIYENNVL